MTRSQKIQAEPASANMGSVPTRTVVKRVVISTFDNPSHPYYNGGGAAVIDMIARRLATSFDVTVVTAGARGGTVAHRGVRYRQLPIGWAGPRFGQLLYHAILPFAIRRTPHDLWIENFTPPFSTSFLPLFSEARVLGFAQALTGREMAARYRLPFYLLENRGLRRYRDVVVLNSADRDVVLQANPSASVRLIPNGIRTAGLDEQILGQGEHILFLGRIDVWKKGLDLLLAAYEISELSMPLIIAGAGLPREERKLRQLMARTNGNVRWVGHVTGRPKQALLEKSAFVIMPSRAETFGLAALEGMSHGKPVLHFDLPTLHWMSGDVSVPCYDVETLARRMDELAGDEAARCELGRKAHAAAQTYGHDETAARYLGLVQELLQVPEP
jgi:glycosyltransferase involved in cell wall biosynthesis